MIALFVIASLNATNIAAQSATLSDSQRTALTHLIDEYATARENRDTVLLKQILSEDVDQLVSTGEWRTGMRAAVEGMLKSSASRPGTRTLTVDKIRLLSATIAIVDCKYQIQNNNATTRNMWSSFVAVLYNRVWKISAIRNMLPAAE